MPEVTPERLETGGPGWRRGVVYFHDGANPITDSDRHLAGIMGTAPEDQRAARVILPVLRAEFGDDLATFLDDVALQAVNQLGCSWQSGVNAMLPLVRQYARQGEPEAVPHA
jgi:hypothetical protein